MGCVSTPGGCVTGGNLAYIMSRFPHLPETFILREMQEMEQLGWKVSIFPLVFQKQSLVHPQARTLLSKVVHTPIYSLALISSNFRAFIKHPAKYCSLFAKMIRNHRASFKFLVRAMVVFPVSVWMAEKMEKNGIQHIHAHYATHPALAAWTIHQLTGIPYSVTMHAHDIFVNQTMLYPKLKDAEFIISISEFNKEFVNHLLGDSLASKIKVVHCGVFPENYQTVPKETTSQPYKIVSIGSLQPYKGQKYLVEACSILQQRNLSFVCQIAGSGALASQLAEQIRSLHLDSVVELLGPKTEEEIAALLHQADCYVQPSIITATGKMEGIPVSLMEAMICEVPVVATSISGIPELVLDGETGYLVAPENSAALADAIEKVIHDPINAKQIASKGKTLVLSQFNLHENGRVLSSLFQNSIQKEHAF